MTTTHRPESLDQALELRGRLGAQVYAGGTDLMPRARRWSGIRPLLADQVMFIGHLPELRGLETGHGRLSIGTCVPLAELMRRPETPGILKTVISSMAAPGVRNLATLGGNVCNASPAGDTLPYLYAMDAALLLQGPSRQREVGIGDFILGPGKTGLADDEILTRISIPLEGFDRQDHRKIAARKANALSKVSFLGLARAIRCMESKQIPCRRGNGLFPAMIVPRGNGAMDRLVASREPGSSRCGRFCTKVGLCGRAR